MKATTSPQAAQAATHSRWHKIKLRHQKPRRIERGRNQSYASTLPT
jgi:hypothetical protein